MSMSEPAKSGNQGYINILIKNTSTSAFKVYSFFWTCLSLNVDDSVNHDCTVFVDVSRSDGTVDLTCYSASKDFFSVGYGRVVDGDNNLTFFQGKADTSSSLSFYTFKCPTGYQIVGYQLYGNAQLFSTDFSTSGSNGNKSFTVIWGSDSQVNSLLTEFIAQLYSIYFQDSEMLDTLDEILNESKSISELLTSIETKCYVNNFQNDTIILYLTEIRNALLNSKGESTFEEPSTDGYKDYKDEEDKLLDGADDTSDIEDSISNFEIDTDSLNVIWSVIEVSVKRNAKVFTLFISMLCLGIIALILNR